MNIFYEFIQISKHGKNILNILYYIKFVRRWQVYKLLFHKKQQKLNIFCSQTKILFKFMIKSNLHFIEKFLEFFLINQYSSNLLFFY